MNKLSVLVCLLSSVLVPLCASAQAPQLINYQGRLLNGTNLVNGNVGLSLRLFNVPTGGTAICEDSNTVTVVDGLYSTIIGDDLGPGFELAESPVAVALTNASVYIEVAVNGFTLSPRERIVSTAYALHARRSDIFTGSVADSQLSANIARLNASNQTFIGPVNFTSTSNTFTGTFSGDAGSLTNVLFSALVANRGPVIAWGQTYYGAAPVPPTVTDVVAIEAGSYHSLALRTDGTVLAWGAGTNNLESLPYYGQCVVPPAATGITAVSGGFFHSLALRSNGTVLAWGAGTNNVGFPHFSQSIVPPEATGVVAIAGGGYHSLALRANGTVVAWGATNGAPYSGQSEVPATATNIVAIAAGSHHSVALRSNGTVMVWGSNVYGQTNVLPTATGVVAIASGEGHVLALRSDGRVVAWGKSLSGQTNVPATATGVVAIAGGGEYSLALRSDGTIIAWGGNANGETDVPAEATGVLAISGGGNHVLALRSTKGNPPFARLDAATSVFQGTISAASFIGDGSGLILTSFVKKVGDTMTGALTAPSIALSSTGSAVITQLGELTRRTAPIAHIVATGTTVIATFNAYNCTAARLGTGSYRVTITTDPSTPYYNPVITPVANTPRFVTITNRTAALFEFNIYDAAGTVQDAGFSATVFGGF